MLTFQDPRWVGRYGTQMGSHAFDEGRPSGYSERRTNNGAQGNAPPEGMLLRAHSAQGAAVPNNGNNEPRACDCATDGGMQINAQLNDCATSSFRQNRVLSARQPRSALDQLIQHGGDGHGRAVSGRARRTVADSEAVLRVYWLIAAVNLAAGPAGFVRGLLTSVPWALARSRTPVVFSSLAGPQRPPRAGSRSRR
jgi:hypothetical protein